MPAPVSPHPASRWPQACALLTATLLGAAALFTGAGREGVAAAPDPGAGHYVYPEALMAGERIDFTAADRAIGRLRLTEHGTAEQFEAYEDVLQAISDVLPPDADEAALNRALYLIRVSLPEGASQELSAMLPGFVRYRRLEHALLELTPDGAGNAEGAWLQLQLQQALRRSMLGEEVAGRLYEATYRMTEIHLVHQLVMQREDLDDAARQNLIRQHMDALMADHDEAED